MSSNSKKKQIQTRTNSQNVATASGLVLEKSLGSLNSVGMTIQADLAKISEGLMGAFGEFQSITGAIEVKKKEMADLHGVDQVLLDIDEVKLKQAAAQEEFKIQELALKENLRLLREEEETRRGREAEEYRYETTKQRKLEEDEWEEKKRQRSIQENDRQVALEKEWASKTAELRHIDLTYKDAIEKAKGFDDAVKKATDAEVAKACSALKQKYEHDKQISDMTLKAEIASLVKDVSSRDAQITNLQTEVQDLKQQLKASIESHTALAKEAMSGAAAQKALADMQNLVTNTMNSPTKRQ